MPGLAYGAGGSTGLAQGHLPLPQRQLPPGAGPPLHPQSTIRAQTPLLDQLRPPGSSSRGSPHNPSDPDDCNRSLRPQAAGCPGTLSKSCWLHVQNLPIFPPCPHFHIHQSGLSCHLLLPRPVQLLLLRIALLLLSRSTVCSY